MIFGREPAAVGAIARLREEQGVDLIGLTDSSALACDPFLGLAAAAMQTSRIRLGVTIIAARCPG